jgi:putative selenate reductase
MPADVDEIKALLTEGIELHELLAPEKLVLNGNRISSIVCAKMELVKSSTDSRPTPVKIEDEFVEFEVDSLIPALGQEIDIDFITSSELKTAKGSYETLVPGVFVGGDALRGAATIVKAVGDGRKAAIQIAAKAGIALPSERLSSDKNMSHSDFITRKSKRVKIDAEISGGASPIHCRIGYSGSFTLPAMWRCVQRLCYGLPQSRQPLLSCPSR